MSLLDVQNAELKNAVRFFTEETGIMAGMAVAAGCPGREAFAADGYADMDRTSPVSAETLCDLASVTKLFTGITAMRLWEKGRLDLAMPVAAADDRFSKLTDTTLDQLMGFEQMLRTPERIDAQPDRDSGLAQLYAAEAFPHSGTRYYSDIHAMVLGKVLERLTGLSLYELIRQEILLPLDMNQTYAKIPAEQLSRCACYDLEHRIEGDQWICRRGILPGMPHDPKARLISPHGEKLCGHAGLFSTLEDLRRLCLGLLSGSVLKKETLRKMARNRMGRRLEGGGWTQYLGTMCYIRHPCQYYSEVPDYMSAAAISMGGFTGNHLSFDPETGRWAVFLGNRVQNRLTVLVPPEGKRRDDYGLNADGTGRIRWTDGQEIPSSVDYVHQKDAHLHAVIRKELGLEQIPYQPLEE